MRVVSLLSLLLLAACGSSPASGGSDVTVVGDVLGVELSALGSGGDALVILRTAGGLRTVRIPARREACTTRAFMDLDGLRPGDRVEARGAEGSRGDLTPCLSPSHYVRKVEG